MLRSTNPREFLTKAEAEAINSAINVAERSSSAELKLVLARHCWCDLKAKAHNIFSELDLDRTEQRNCILLMLVVSNREFLIYGDQGIHEKVGQDFWDDIRDDMVNAFVRDEFGEGLSTAIRQIGEKLALYFPFHQDDTDEVSNEIIYRS